MSDEPETAATAPVRIPKNGQVREARPARVPRRAPSAALAITAALAGTVLFGVLFVGSFTGGLHAPRPHAIPVGIVAAPAAGRAIAVFALIIAAADASVTDGLVGALTGAPLGLFGIGALLAFAAAAATAAAARWGSQPAASRWGGQLAPVALVLLFVPVGVPASGGPYGPSLITPWYAHLGAALLPGAARPALRDLLYFHGNAITRPLLVLAAWATAGALALTLAAPRRPLHNSNA